MIGYFLDGPLGGQRRDLGVEVRVYDRVNIPAGVSLLATYERVPMKETGRRHWEFLNGIDCSLRFIRTERF